MPILEGIFCGRGRGMLISIPAELPPCRLQGHQMLNAHWLIFLLPKGNDDRQATAFDIPLLE